MDKLQELTQKLYNEGLSKGKEEGEAILAKAQAEAGTAITWNLTPAAVSSTPARSAGTPVTPAPPSFWIWKPARP